MLNELKIFKLRPDAKGIVYGSDYAACFDVSAYMSFQSSVKSYTKTNLLVEILCSQDDTGAYVDVPPEWRILVPTGLIFDIPENHCVRIYPRSGISTKKGLNLINCVGIIDEDYVQEVFIPIYNNSQEKIRIYNGERIAQGELAKVERPFAISYINERPERKGNRDGGFGSTGII